MTATKGLKGKRVGWVLLGLVLLALVFAYFFSTRAENAPSADTARVISTQDTVPVPSESRQSSGNAEPAITGTAPEQNPTEDHRASDDAADHAGSHLQEEELDHLGEVFLNSVYPSFEHDFQVDREGRSAIDVFVASMPEDLSDQDVDTISTMITTRFSGPDGENLAFIITHLYRLEREEARLMNKAGPVATMADQLEAREKLSRLREQWFGPELSEALFSGSDDEEAGSGENAASGQSEVGSTEEAPADWSEEQAELAAIERAWEQRSRAFRAEKQIIDNAGLDQAEKDRQSETLLRQHYAPEELEAARAFAEQD
ncbi:lipase chaperone [Marinobacter salicampi]|uniref:lipase chaperone n=1 Tax=Marinobacter salicampi TaxID=435907 RepID=UPI001408620C|nr:lipase chaperone [Marinobacter salicampi]